MIFLSELEWRERQRAHVARVNEWLEPHCSRVSRGERHPVYDFLFEYYRFKPALLRRWHPGLGVILQGESAREFLRWNGYSETADGVLVDANFLKPERMESVRWLLGMLRATQQRPAYFGCFGLHEWAMVYRAPADAVRHSRWPLRFAPAEIARIVEAASIRCTHFDAFRFFTAEARPLNRVQPTRATSASHEQRGCLHANMDLYKWAFKLTPFTPSELVANAFDLAREIRAEDMRASPYDFSRLGFAPIPIETAEGRAEYERHQRAFAQQTVPIRERLIALCETLLRSSESALFTTH